MGMTPRRRLKKRRFFGFVVIVAFLLAIYQSNWTLGVTHYEIVSSQLPASFDDFTIVQLSDLHDAEFGERFSKLTKKVRDADPHLIVVTGDVIDSNRYDLEQSLELIEELVHEFPIYYVTGNHEIATNEADHIKASLRSLGVHVLSNEAMIWTKNDDRIAVGGIEDLLQSPLADEAAARLFVDTAFSDVPADMFKVLLSHRPEQFQTYMDARIDVTFTGHAHGGQVRLPGVGGLMAPGQGWLPDYTSGVHEQDGRRMVISRGLGNSILPVRLFNAPEVVVVTLKHQPS